MTTPGTASHIDVPDAGGSRSEAARAARAPRPLTDRTLGLVTAAVTLPLLWMGYGTDIDVHDVLASGDSIRSGDYMPSRPPGVPVFEAVVAPLGPPRGPPPVNLGTARARAPPGVGP